MGFLDALENTLDIAHDIAQTTPMQKTTPPTSRQRQVLKFVRSFIAKHGYSPTFAEIATHFDIEENGAKGHVERMVTKGLLSRTRGKARSIRIL